MSSNFKKFTAVVLQLQQAKYFFLSAEIDRLTPTQGIQSSLIVYFLNRNHTS